MLPPAHLAGLPLEEMAPVAIAAAGIGIATLRRSLAAGLSRAAGSGRRLRSRVGPRGAPR